MLLQLPLPLPLPLIFFLPLPLPLRQKVPLPALPPPLPGTLVAMEACQELLHLFLIETRNDTHMILI